jgi:hypothetical protein
MDKYKNGHYSTYLDNIPRTWTSIRMVTIAISAIVTILILVHVLGILSR